MSSALSPEDRERLDALFDRAAELPSAEHAAFVERECGSDDILSAELERLLAGLAGEDILAGIHTEAPTRAGTRIGPYKLLERVGEGGMGEVYAAQQLDPVERRVALKLIKPGMDSSQVVARFEAERQALALMTHPNIARILDGGATDDGRPYFVMEFVAGEPITEYCDRCKLSTRARLELFVALCDGVQHAHQKGIIHRDLKPSNLLVAQEDGRAVPKIIDFGVARATSGRLAERTLRTMVGQIVGTLDYMSPEQADPSEVDVDTRSDVYSLGVVLYQLLSGLLPFEHPRDSQLPLFDVQRMIREQDPPTPSTRLRRKTGTATAVAPLHGTDERSLLRQLSGDLDWICMKALEKDPDRRYSSASELAADVRRHFAHEPVLAGRPGMIYRVGKFVRRNRLGVTAGAVVAAAVLIGIVGIVLGQLEARASERFARAALDAERVLGLEVEADDLWPPYPERIEELIHWLGRTREIVDQLPRYREMLEELRERGGDPYRIEAIAKAIEGAERLQSGLLAENVVGQEHGWSVSMRLRFARKLQEAFADGGEYAEAWPKALPEIRAAYGRDLGPQVGLLPLGADKVSGLWEFAHLLTGKPAVRDGDGKLIITDETGLVFVLIPSGSFVMGAQWENPEKDNYDESAKQARAGCPEGPPVSVHFEEPFFISKFEMTQGQWESYCGSNPSNPAEGLFPTKPVNMVSWTICDRTMRRLGLSLPSEEQWEYTARAGTSSIWSAGNEGTSLRGFGNVFDLSASRAAPNFLMGESAAEWDDGFAPIAPVGQFEPNPWGLYDVHGNALEWCSNSPYEYGTAPGRVPGTLGIRCARGGSYRMGPFLARSAWRINGPKGLAGPDSGLRPTRALDELSED